EPQSSDCRCIDSGHRNYIAKTPDNPLSAKKRLTIQKAFEEYWETGGFPEVAGLDRMLRIKTHQEDFNAMLFSDIVERHDAECA
ncbi:MAG TPA: hypothetical protein PLM07_05755, partial [Candidatus Rifleibacterium sp.]|nr:hypothetical protein [Candidatus Rifleibacterium sp.]